jgi:hypothetical protein
MSIASLFWSDPSFSNDDVVLTIEGPDRATSGEEITYTIKWQNNTKLDLKDMSFRLFYPEGSVVIEDGQPTQPDSEGFTVEKLKPGESGEREVTLFLVGDKGSIKTAAINLIFKAGTLRSAFEKEVKATTAITTLPVSITLTAPPTLVSGQPLTYIIDVRNETEEDFSDLRLEVTYPEGFTVQTLNPDPGGSTNTWELDQLDQGEGKRYTIRGSLSGVEREAKTVTATLKRQVGDQYIDYVRADSVTLLSSPLLSVRMTVNKSRDYVAFPGDRLKYAIQYTNNSRHNLIGLELGVRLEGQMYDLENLEVRQGFFDQFTNTVRFSASGVPDFASLAPGKSGTVEFDVPLRPNFVGGSGAQSFFVKAVARLSTPNVPTGVDGNEVFSQDIITTKIGSQPSLAQNLKHFGGPLPLEVGQESTFTVDWSISNPGNELRDSRVTVTLPPGISFKNDASSSNGLPPDYDPNTQQVTWQIGSIPYGIGAGTEKYTAKFQISAQPSANQRGESIKLLTNTILSGTDSFTGQPVQMVIREATTNDIEGFQGDPRVQ